MSAIIRFVELLTARLKLRSWRDGDVEPYAAMNADPRVREFFPSILTYAESARSAQHIRAHFDRHGFGLWAVEVVGGAPFIGFTGLAIPSIETPFMPCVEIGWRLAFEQLAFGFTSLGLQEIVAMTATGNLRSRRVMDRLGMTHNPADDFDHPVIEPGHPLRRHVLYRLHHREWSGVFSSPRSRTQVQDEG